MQTYILGLEQGGGGGELSDLSETPPEELLVECE